MGGCSGGDADAVLSTEKSRADVEPPWPVSWGRAWFGQQLVAHLASTSCPPGTGAGEGTRQRLQMRGSSCLHGGWIHNPKGDSELRSGLLSCRAQISLKCVDPHTPVTRREAAIMDLIKPEEAVKAAVGR